MVRNKGSKIVRTPADKARARYTELHVHQEGELMDFIMKQMSGISRTSVKSMLSNRRVTVENTIVTQYNYPLTSGMRVRISKSKNNKEFTSPYLKLLFEDTYFMVIEKKEGLPCNTQEGKNQKRSVYSILTEYIKRTARERRIYMVHSLDTNSSGLMIIAKDEKTRNTFQSFWEEIIQKQTYVAVVEGNVEKDKGVVVSWIKEEDKHLYISYVLTSNNNGNKSISSYKTIKRSDKYSLLEIETTRNSQVRLHMSSLKNPIVGDERNGAQKSPIARMALHAFCLNFYHPVTGELMTFETTYPSNFKGLLVNQPEEKIK